ncbi:MAG: hypothetical protein DBX47_02760 [Clostridiales bacterium]|nr:MAG: hypothetical protein DBX47_02760 [Clostridiales bacterium]
MEKEFEQILIGERKKRKLSLREASAQIGICHTYLSALEKGRDPRTGTKLEPSQDVVLKICKAYELNLSDAIPLFNFHDKYELYSFIARQINELKHTKPAQYRELVKIINQ